jgi:hypothetical protein
MTQPDLSIGLLTWRSKALLQQVLDSILATCEGVSYEIIVVDNASGDGTVEMLQSQYPAVQVIANAVNRGVAPARNQIIERSQGRYVCYLDVDTKVLPHALKTLVSVMDEHPEFAIAGPKLLYADGTLQLSCRPFPSPLNILIEGTFLREVFPNSGYVKNYTLEDWDHAELREIDWMYGACMIIRRELFDKIGPFDEGYFYQYEDVDICFRARRAGERVLYVPQAEIIHFYERERKSVFHPKVMTHIRSILRYLRKDYYGFAGRPPRVGGGHAVYPDHQPRLSGADSRSGQSLGGG